MTLTRDRLLELLDYDADTGAFRWRTRRCNAHRLSALAGTITDKGHRRIQLDGGNYRAGRLAWLYVTGSWPSGEVDHFDRDPANDSWKNLRDVGDVEQARNKSAQKRNPIGVRGVSLVKPRGRTGPVRYSAQIGVGGKLKWLGQFATVAEAVMAREQAEAELWQLT